MAGSWLSQLRVTSVKNQDDIDSRIFLNFSKYHENIMFFKGL